MNGNVSLGWNQYQGSRSIIFPGVDRTAESQYTGHEYSAELGAGLPIKTAGWVLLPHLSGRYHHIEIDPYSEKNAGDLGLSIHRQHYEIILGDVGIKLSKAFPLKGGILLVPELRLERQYNFIRQAEASQSSFIGGGDYFETQGLTPYKDSISKGFGIDLALPRHWVWGMDYHMLSSKSYTAQSLIVTGRLQF
jgi:outer membrane autotransporter protein